MKKKRAKKRAFDSDFQEKLVRLLYQDEGFATLAIEFIEPDIFENPIHQWVVKKIAWSHSVLGHHLTPTVLKQEYNKARGFKLIKKEHLPLYKKFFATKLDRPVPDRTYIKTEVQNFVKSQRWKQFLLYGAEEGIHKSDFADLEKRALEVLDLDLTGNHSIGTFVGKTYRKRIKARDKEEVSGIETPIPELNRLMTPGGLPKKQLGTIIAPTGRGKSNILIDIAVTAVLAGHKVAFYTCELEEEVIGERMDARVSGVPMRLLRSNPTDVEAGWRKVASKVSDSLVVKEYPSGSLTVGMMKAHLRQLERYGFYPDLVVVDYADIMKSRIEYSDSSYETQGQIYTDLRGFAMEQNLAVWTGTQGNRSSMKNEEGNVGLGDVADSVKKVFISDVILALLQSEKEAKENKMRIGLLKNRNGPKDREIAITVDHSTCKFRERR